MHTDIATFYVKTFPLENENRELLFHFQSSSVPPIFGIISCCRTWSAKRSQASDMLWMKLKLKGAPKRNRSGRCSEIWEYQSQNCKGACATFLVSNGGPFGNATKINKKNGSKIFWGKKSVTKSPWASQNATKQSCYEKLFFWDEKMFEKSSNLSHGPLAAQQKTKSRQILQDLCLQT